MDLYGELQWRGLVYDATEGLRDLITRGDIGGRVAIAHDVRIGGERELEVGCRGELAHSLRCVSRSSARSLGRTELSGSAFR